MAIIPLLAWLFFGQPNEPVFITQVLDQLAKTEVDDFGELVLAAGRAFLKAPYEAHTLESDSAEKLVVQLSSFDCFTLMESSLALARASRSGIPDEACFRRELRRIRYRDGRLEGYPSRLHYTSDWIGDNAGRGIVDDLTADLGGLQDTRIIDFMSTHRTSYKKLSDQKNFSAILEIEDSLNTRMRTILPKRRIQAVEAQIHNGDLLAMATSVEGLDIAHVGLAIRVAGRIHMLHASSKSGRVEITAEPLHEFVKTKKSWTGICVIRPRNPAPLNP